MSTSVLSLPGVAAPGTAVICGALLVIVGNELVGVPVLVLGLLVYAYVHIKTSSA